MKSIFTASGFSISNLGAFTVRGKATITSLEGDKWYEIYLMHNATQQKGWLEYDNGVLTYYTRYQELEQSQQYLGKIMNELIVGNQTEIAQKKWLITAEYEAIAAQVSGNVDDLEANERFKIKEAIAEGVPITIEFYDKELEVYRGVQIAYADITQLG